jgi:hypothetical protein
MASAVAEAARRQVLFREVNEQIAKLTGLLAGSDSWLLICECSKDGCADSLEIGADEYEAVRAEGARFVVLPGHELAEVERVVAGNSRYLVVEKLGQAAEIAYADDPRS